MNGMLRDLLNERAEAAGDPDLDLRALIAHGERRVTRRRYAVLGGTAAAVALTVGASLAVVQAGDRTAPDIPVTTDSPSTSTELAPDPTAANGKEPLTYGVGATIHYGDRTIEAPEDADGLFVFDHGLAILTGDDGNNADNRLHFTDGSELVEIARRVGQLAAGEVGSLLVWVAGNDVVIYDTAVLRVLARVPLGDRYVGYTITPLEDAVYWHELREGTVTTEGLHHLVRYDVTTGTRTRVSQAEYQAATRPAARPVVVGSAGPADPATGFVVVDGELRGETGSGATGPAFVAATGERLQVTVPEGYEGQSLYVFQWLDDERFALVSSGGLKGAPIGDLLLCRISAGQCHTIASGEEYWLLPGPGASVGTED